MRPVRVGCPKCQTILHIDVSLVGEMVMCGACNHEFMAGSSSEMWYLHTDGVQYGPVERHALDLWAREGRIKPNALLLRQGEAAWQPAPTLYPFLGPVPPQPAAPQATPQEPKAEPVKRDAKKDAKSVRRTRFNLSDTDLTGKGHPQKRPGSGVRPVPEELKSVSKAKPGIAPRQPTKIRISTSGIKKEEEPPSRKTRPGTSVRMPTKLRLKTSSIQKEEKEEKKETGARLKPKAAGKR